ncbi:MAG: SET domain-containing protein [Candidatus Moraniibacteriota bacterium]
MPKRKIPKNVAVKRSSAGLGLFATEEIAKGARIIEYVGRRVKTSEDIDNKYIFNINKKIDIDGSPRWNTARYINHSCRPNAEAVNEDGRIFIEARRRILAGEEITYHYGKDYYEGIIKKIGCLCEKHRA